VSVGTGVDVDVKVGLGVFVEVAVEVGTVIDVGVEVILPGSPKESAVFSAIGSWVGVSCARLTPATSDVCTDTLGSSDPLQADNATSVIIAAMERPIRSHVDFFIPYTTTLFYLIK
jgi:hypothetical protein